MEKLFLPRLVQQTIFKQAAGEVSGLAADVISEVTVYFLLLT